MGLQALFTCDVCVKTEMFSGPDAISTLNKSWKAIPDKKLGWETDKWSSHQNQFVHEWVCSFECMGKWVELDPKNRVIFIPDKDYYGDDTWSPSYIIRRTKKYIWLCLYNAQINLENGNWTGRGGYNGRCHGKLREEDRIRLFK